MTLVGLGTPAAWAAIVLVATAVVGLARRIHRRAWRLGACARRLGFTVRPGRGGLPDEMSGDRDGFHVVVHRVHVFKPGASSASGMRVAVSSGGRWPHEARRPGAWTWAPDDGSLFPADPEEGWMAPSRIEAAEAAQLALFDAPAEQAWREWQGWLVGRPTPCDGAIEGGTVSLLLDRIALDPRLLEAHLERMVALAWRLDRGLRSIPECLADGVRDGDAETRRRRLRILAQRFGREAVAQRALREGLQDPDAEARLEAARGLEREGAATLRQLAEDRRVPPALRARALHAWFSALMRGRAAASPELEEVHRLLGDLADDGSRTLRIEVLRLANELNRAMPLRALARRASHASDEEAVEIARALALHRGEEAESALLALLKTELPALRVIVLGSLRDVGTIACVPAVLPFTKGILVDDATKSTARETLRAVRARMGPADAGRLSLADVDEATGALSAPVVDGGALALPPADAGAVSRPEEAGPDETDP